MKLLKCIVCRGEVDILDDSGETNKLVKCKSCGFTNEVVGQKYPEVLVMRKRNNVKI